MKSDLTIRDVLEGKTFQDKPVYSEVADVQEAIRALNILTDKQRMEVFSNFCRYCGCKDPNCVCSYDE